MTQLCTITGCRIRGRHLPGCDDDRCPGCLPRIADEGHTCKRCDNRADGQLGAIGELIDDARAVAAGEVRRGTGGGGGGKPGSRPPLNDTATDALDAVQNRLTTLAREIAETRGLQSVSAVLEGRTVPDPLVRAAEWLRGQIRWVKHALDDQGDPYAVGAYAEIADCARRIRGIVNGPTEQRYFGPCGEVVDGQACDGDTYGWPGAELAACKTCGHQVDQLERRAWLDDQVRDRAFRASEIEDAYGVSANLIRQWATPARGLLQVHGHDFWGRALYVLGDVLDVAAAQVAKRAEAQARQARREADRAAKAAVEAGATS